MEQRNKTIFTIYNNLLIYKKLIKIMRFMIIYVSLSHWDFLQKSLPNINHHQSQALNHYGHRYHLHAYLMIEHEVFLEAPLNLAKSSIGPGVVKLLFFFFIHNHHQFCDVCYSFIQLLFISYLLFCNFTQYFHLPIWDFS